MSHEEVPYGLPDFQGISTAGVSHEGDSSPLNEGGVGANHPFDGTDRSYHWVNPKVLSIQSKFQSLDSLKELKECVVDHEGRDRVDCLPCLSEDRVCHSADAAAPSFFFMHKRVLTKVGVRLPFSDFECAILRCLNIAPSQLHPNSWAFVRAFNILCNFLGISATTQKFFSFFCVKHKGRIGWISLISIQHRKILESFSSSWKGFKPEFFKIVNKGSAHPFYLFDSGKPMFPLYWSSFPNIIRGLKYHSLSTQERLEMSYLRQFVDVSCRQLIEAGDDPSKLDAFMGSMAPKLSRKALLEFLDQDGKKVGNVVATSGGAKKDKGKLVINLSDDSNHIEGGFRFRKRTLEKAKNEGVVASKRRVKGVVTGEPSHCDNPDNTFHQMLASHVEFHPEIASLWNPSFMAKQASLDQLQYPTDTGLYQSLSRPQIAKMVEVLSLRLASLACFSNLDASSIEIRMADLEAKNKRLKQKAVEGQHLMSEFMKIARENESLKKHLHSVAEDMISSRAHVARLEESCSTLAATKDSLQVELTVANKKIVELAKEAKELKVFSARRLFEGFNAAQEQFSCVYPNLDSSMFSIKKEVRDGRLVGLDEGEVVEN